MVWLPGSGGAAPVAPTTVLKAGLSPVLFGGRCRLTGEIERDELLEKPVTVGADDMKSGSMGGWEPLPVDDPTAEDLLQAVGRRPPVGGAAMSLSPEVVGVIVEVHAIARRSQVPDQSSGSGRRRCDSRCPVAWGWRRSRHGPRRTSCRPSRDLRNRACDHESRSTCTRPAFRRPCPRCRCRPAGEGLPPSGRPSRCRLGRPRRPAGGEARRRWARGRTRRST